MGGRWAAGSMRVGGWWAAGSTGVGGQLDRQGSMGGGHRIAMDFRSRFFLAISILNDQTAPRAILHPIHEKSTYEPFGIQKSKNQKTQRN